MLLLLIVMVLKKLLTGGLSTFFIKRGPVFSNDHKNLPKIPLDCPILCNRSFDSFTLDVKSFAKTLRSLKTCVLVMWKIILIIRITKNI